jgi:hypothetical protein
MTKLKPREQGDIGELSAMEWLASRGAHIYVPVGHSPDVDLVAEVSGDVSRIEVKTSTQRVGARWGVNIATRGGNQSWSGLVKRFDTSRCEFLFVHVGDGRRWLIPTGALDCESSLTLGGPKYAEFEIESGRPLAARSSDVVLQSGRSPGEYPRGQRMAAVNRPAQSFAGSTPASPISSPRRVKPSNYERKPGQRGEAIINQKRRLTIPQRPFFEAGFANCGRVRVRADGPGRLVVEQIELPSWAQAELPDS